MSFLRRLFGAWSRAAPPPSPWPASWFTTLQAPAVWVDDEAIGRVAADAAQLAGFAAPPRQGEPSAWIHWASTLGWLPPAATGGIEVFCRRAAEAHRLTFGVDELAEDLHEQMGPGEVLGQWVLVAADDDGLWYVDRSVAPRLRLLQVSFDYDHQHVRREVSCAGELVGWVVSERLATARPPEGLAPPNVSPRSVALDADAWALSFALEELATPVPETMAFDVAALRAPVRAWALLQLRAAGRARTCRLDVERPNGIGNGVVIEGVGGASGPGAIDPEVAAAVRERREEIASSNHELLAALRRAVRPSDVDAHKP